MKLFMLLILIGVVMLFFRQLFFRRAKRQKKNQSVNVRSSRHQQRQEKMMQQSIGLNEASVIPQSKDESAGFRVEPVLVSAGTLHETRVSRESTPVTKPEVLPTKKNEKVRRKSENIISFFVLPPKGQPFAGYELLQSILSRGLRFGQDKIFHRHVNPNGTGEELFHLAAATKEGVFDLPNMGAYSCPGLICYFYLDECQSPKQALDVMHETVEGLAKDLGGEVLDQIKRPLTNETLGLIRQHIEKYVAAERV